MNVEAIDPHEWSEHIQVVSRIRPVNRRELYEEKDIIVTTDSNQAMVRAQILNEASGVYSDREFSFDAHYGPMATQSELYQRPAALVESVLNGCNATVFAYGQTGAGKSFTMFGPDELPGVLPRAGKQIFDRITELHDSDHPNAVISRQCSVQCSFLQIYNERISDLLLSPEELKSNRQFSSDLRVKECRQAGLYVNGLSWVDVHSADEFMDAYKKGQRNQLIETTMMSNASSRITSVFSAVITCKSRTDSEESITCGKLTIVEMAGSERWQKTGMQGMRLSEASKIGLSLSAFGNVVEALTSDKKKHIPYRDSKFTRLLQASFGGNSRTLMIACICPTDGLESLSTLRHAARIMKIQNKFRVNTSPVVTTVPPTDPVLSAAVDPLPPCLPAPVATHVAPTPAVIVRPSPPDPSEHLLKRIALLEKMIAVCVPDEALVAKLEASAVWNDDKREWSIPVHYAAKVLSHVNQADVVDVCGTHGVCDEETDWVVVDERK